MAKSRIVSVGEVLWDVFPNKKCFGGAPANFAFHTNSLGAESFIVSSVGDDALGREALEYLEDHGLSVSYIAKVSGKPTGYVDVSLDAAGVASYVFPDDVAWDNLSWSDSLEELAGTADVVCFSTIAQRSEVSRTTINRFLSLCQKDCLRVYDVNLRAGMYEKETILSLLNCCDVVKLNEDELPVVLDVFSEANSQFNGNVESLVDVLSLKAVLYTCGEQGARLYTAEGVVSADAVKCDAISTVGAGDSFTASVVMGMLKGMDAKDNLEHAAKVAAYVCGHEGAMVPLPSGLL